MTFDDILKEKEEGRKYILDKLWDDGELVEEYNGYSTVTYYTITELEKLERIKDNVDEIEALIENGFWKV